MNQLHNCFSNPCSSSSTTNNDSLNLIACNDTIAGVIRQSLNQKDCKQHEKLQELNRLKALIPDTGKLMNTPILINKKGKKRKVAIFIRKKE